MSFNTAEAFERIASNVVGRRRETELVVAALLADRHVVLEGPPGTGKSTLLRAVSDALGVGFEFVEGNAELTPARLVGHFDPARVLSDGYAPDVFIDGPLVRALRSGSLLYVEELNRVPEETLNVLVTVMSERELTVPRLGRIDASPGFRLVAAMNPFDAVGTARISSAISDRVCRVALGYQSPPEEAAIVAAQDPRLEPAWVANVVEVVRRTRSHADVRVGSSVRGAIDTALVAVSLGELRRRSVSAVGLDAALVALSGRLRMREGSSQTPESVITDIWVDVFGREFESASDPGKDDPAGKARAPGIGVAAS